jgi:hypothetical protein
MSAPVISVVEVKTIDKPRGHWVNDRNYGRRGGYYVKDETNIKTRLYLWPEGEDVIENFLVGRHTRPVSLYRLALPVIFKELQIGPYKAVWSRTAGCSCGCSPAFVLDARLGYDIYATVKYEQPALTPEQLATVAARVAAWQADPTLPALVTA